MIRDDIMAVKKEVNELKQESFTLELLKDFKKQNQRQFIIILVILTMWLATIGYLVYVLNDIGYEEITTETYEVEQEAEDGNNNFIRGNNNEVK